MSALKPPHLRQRRNKVVGATELPAESHVAAPEIPNPDGRVWHPLTVKWWEHVWTSPMASQYIPTDVDGLGLLAMLINSYYLDPDPKLLAEIRLQRACFGLTNLDRVRLQWEIGKVDELGRRRNPKSQPASKKPASDPRNVLREKIHAVK